MYVFFLFFQKFLIGFPAMDRYGLFHGNSYKKEKGEIACRKEKA